MKKIFPNLLLFLFILSFFSCTITKRRYTGGYYVNWHSKTPSARLVAQTRTPQVAINKIAQSKNPSIKTAVEVQTEKTNFQKVEQSISTSQKVRGLSKNNPITNSVSSTYTITPENTLPGHNAPENAISKQDVRISLLFCLLGFLSGLIFGVIAVGLALRSTYNNFDAVLLLIAPLIPIIISLVHSYLGIKNGHKWGLLAIILLDLIFGAILIIAIFGLLFFP